MPINYDELRRQVEEQVAGLQQDLRIPQGELGAQQLTPQSLGIDPDALRAQIERELGGMRAPEAVDEPPVELEPQGFLGGIAEAAQRLGAHTAGTGTYNLSVTAQYFNPLYHAGAINEYLGGAKNPFLSPTEIVQTGHEVTEKLNVPEEEQQLHPIVGGLVDAFGDYLPGTVAMMATGVPGAARAAGGAMAAKPVAALGEMAAKEVASGATKLSAGAWTRQALGRALTIGAEEAAEGAVYGIGLTGVNEKFISSMEKGNFIDAGEAMTSELLANVVGGVVIGSSLRYIGGPIIRGMKRFLSPESGGPVQTWASLLPDELKSRMTEFQKVLQLEDALEQASIAGDNEAMGAISTQLKQFNIAPEERVALLHTANRGVRDLIADPGGLVSHGSAPVIDEPFQMIPGAYKKDLNWMQSILNTEKFVTDNYRRMGQVIKVLEEQGAPVPEPVRWMQDESLEILKEFGDYKRGMHQQRLHLLQKTQAGAKLEPKEQLDWDFFQHLSRADVFNSDGRNPAVRLLTELMVNDFSIMRTSADGLATYPYAAEQRKQFYKPLKNLEKKINTLFREDPDNAVDRVVDEIILNPEQKGIKTKILDEIVRDRKFMEVLDTTRMNPETQTLGLPVEVRAKLATWVESSAGKDAATVKAELSALLKEGLKGGEVDQTALVGFLTKPDSFKVGKETIYGYPSHLANYIQWANGPSLGKYNFATTEGLLQGLKQSMKTLREHVVPYSVGVDNKLGLKSLEATVRQMESAKLHKTPEGRAAIAGLRIMHILMRDSAGEGLWPGYFKGLLKETDLDAAGVTFKTGEIGVRPSEELGVSNVMSALHEFGHSFFAALPAKVQSRLMLQAQQVFKEMPEEFIEYARNAFVGPDSPLLVGKADWETNIPELYAEYFSRLAMKQVLGGPRDVVEKRFAEIFAGMGKAEKEALEKYMRQVAGDISADPLIPYEFRSAVGRMFKNFDGEVTAATDPMMKEIKGKLLAAKQTCLRKQFAQFFEPNFDENLFVENLFDRNMFNIIDGMPRLNKAGKILAEEYGLTAPDGSPITTGMTYKEIHQAVENKMVQTGADISASVRGVEEPHTVQDAIDDVVYVYNDIKARLDVGVAEMYSPDGELVNLFKYKMNKGLAATLDRLKKEYGETLPELVQMVVKGTPAEKGRAYHQISKMAQELFDLRDGLRGVNPHVWDSMPRAYKPGVIERSLLTMQKHLPYMKPILENGPKMTWMQRVFNQAQYIEKRHPQFAVVSRPIKRIPTHTRELCHLLLSNKDNVLGLTPGTKTLLEAHELFARRASVGLKVIDSMKVKTEKSQLDAVVDAFAELSDINNHISNKRLSAKQEIELGLLRSDKGVLDEEQMVKLAMAKGHGEEAAREAYKYFQGTIETFHYMHNNMMKFLNEIAPETASAIRQEMDKLGGKIPGFLPQTRKGDWVIQVLQETPKGDKTKVLWRSQYKTYKEAEKALADLQTKGAMEHGLGREHFAGLKVVPKEKTNPQQAFGASPEHIAGIFNKAFKTLEDQGVEGLDKLKRATTGALGEELKQGQFLQHTQFREGVPGFKKQDIFEAIDDYVNSYVGFITRHEAMQSAIKGLPALERDPRLFAEGEKIIRDAIQGTTDSVKWVRHARSIAVINYMAFNVSTSALQVVQNATHGVSVMALNGIPRAGRLMTRAYKDVLGEYSTKLVYKRGVRDFLMGRGPVHTSPKFKSRFRPEEVSFLEKMKISGQTDANWVDMATSHGLGGTKNTLLERGANHSAFMLREMEIINRNTMALATYRHYMPKYLKQGLSFERAEQETIRHATQMINDAHMDYTTANLPTWARGDTFMAGVGRAAYIFQTFAHGSMQLLGHFLRSGSQGEKAAAKMVAALLLFGGASAVPGYELLTSIYEKGTGVPFEKEVKEWAGYDGGRLVTQGPLSLVLPFDFGQRLNPSPVLGRDATFTGTWEDAKKSWTAAKRGDFVDSLTTLPLMPKIARNIIRGQIEHTQGFKTATGRRLADKYGRPIKNDFAGTVSRFMGFRPENRELTEYYYQKAIQRNMRQRRLDLGAKFVTKMHNREAFDRGDYESMWELMMKGSKHGIKFRGYSPYDWAGEMYVTAD